jgi:hypothetical protein
LRPQHDADLPRPAGALVAELAIDDRCKRAEALEALRRGYAIMVRLTALSRNNAGWKRDLTASKRGSPNSRSRPRPCSEPFAAELRGPSNARLNPMCSFAP